MTEKTDRLIPEHCRDHVLLIPDGLGDFADAKALMVNGFDAIYRKHITQDMEGIEFYTNAPCLAYVLAGKETFTTSDHEQVTVQAHDMLFMARDLFMISDFVNRDGPLEAWLFFFDEQTIERFLLRGAMPEGSKVGQPVHVIAANDRLKAFVDGLEAVYGGFDSTPDLLRLKLLELLFLLEGLAPEQDLRRFLSLHHRAPARRSIRHVMESHYLQNLTVSDFARLSGRSPSGFNRDFQRLYGETPRQWLIEKRIQAADTLIRQTDASVTEVALQVGYSDTTHFIRAFKKRFGVTPKRARLASL